MGKALPTINRYPDVQQAVMGWTIPLVNKAAAPPFKLRPIHRLYRISKRGSVIAFSMRTCSMSEICMTLPARLD
jgi:hypothetical protein